MKMRRLVWLYCLTVAFATLALAGNKCFSGGRKAPPNANFELQSEELEPIESRFLLRHIPTGWERGNWLAILVAPECTKILAIATFLGTHSYITKVEQVQTKDLAKLPMKIEHYIASLPVTIDAVGIVSSTTSSNPIIQQLLELPEIKGKVSVFDEEIGKFLVCKACFPTTEFVLILNGLESRLLYIDSNMSKHELVSIQIPIISTLTQISIALNEPKPTPLTRLNSIWKRRSVVKSTELALLQTATLVLKNEIERIACMIVDEAGRKHLEGKMRIVVDGEMWTECEMVRDLALEFIKKVQKVQVEFFAVPGIRELGLFGAAMGACCLAD